MTHDVTVSSRIIISPIKCGDIISFKRENGDIYGKRVIGVAGDEVMIIGGHVYINGEKLEEAYIAGDVKTHAGETVIFNVPENSFLYWEITGRIPMIRDSGKNLMSKEKM